MTGIQKAGIVITLLSIVLGVGGTIWSLFSTFVALETAEYAGLKPIEETVEYAIWFTIAGIAGVATGIGLIIVGRKRAESRTRSDL